MKKKIIYIILSILIFISLSNNAFGLEFQVRYLDSNDGVQLFGTGGKIGGGGYYFRYGNYYDEAGNYKGGIPGGASFPPDYNDRKKTVIDTGYYWYYISSANAGTYDHKQLVVVNKKTGEIFSKRFTGDFYGNYGGSSYIPFFYYNGNIIVQLGATGGWYYFDKGSVEFNIAPSIKPYVGPITSLTIQGKEFYYANEYGNDIYTLYGDIFRAYQFASDGNGNILRASTDLNIPTNSPYTRFRINKSNSGIFYLSFINTTTSSVWMKGYSTNSLSWVDYPNKYMLFYNPDVGYGWTVGDYPTIPYYISETGRIASIGKWTNTLLKYVKYYQKTDKVLYTNDILITDTSGSGTTLGGGNTGTGNTSSGTTNTGTTSSGSTSSGSIFDTSSIVNSLTSLFGVNNGDLTNLKNSLSGALSLGSNGFSIGTGGISSINYIPGNQNYGVIIGKDTVKQTCDMFNADGSFAYYSNGSYDLSINLNGILNLGYADKVPFLEELLFIPNKILSFITNPLNNILSTLRVFGGIGENTYCYFGTLQTIKFQKHIIMGTSFFGGNTFIPGTLTIIDYLILFFVGLPLLILTVRILLY